MSSEDKLWMIIDRVALLEAGQTFSTTYEAVVDHRSWGTALWRTYQGENRRQTLMYLSKIIEEGFSYFEVHVGEELMKRLLRGVQGLAKLQFTYCDDEQLVEEIRQLCQQYNERIILTWENSKSPLPDPYYFANTLEEEVKKES